MTDTPFSEGVGPVAELVRDGTGRRLAELAEVTGLDERGDYRILPFIPHVQGDNT